MTDLNKPRYRRDYGLKIKLVNREFFKLYKEKFPNTKIDTYSKMREVLNVVHDEITDIVSEEPAGFDLMNIAYLITIAYYLPEEKLKESGKYVNLKLTREYDKEIKYLNLHTDGKYCKIFFSMDLPKYKFKYRKAWSFIACRKFKRKVSASFKQNFNKFVTSEKGESLRRIFNSYI